ncbi:chromosome segregation protein Csm1/Pcs1-domain-containing protein [Lipomyces oligophaga]|uniref:chromosome segregation protein Csm1/Pcs1-domain-containing protein n=1 Tax=Lipomyces oligophaga TaxID=45792 RepID=UPI0034CDFC6F
MPRKKLADQVTESQVKKGRPTTVKDSLSTISTLITDSDPSSDEESYVLHDFQSSKTKKRPDRTREQGSSAVKKPKLGPTPIRRLEAGDEIRASPKSSKAAGKENIQASILRKKITPIVRSAMTPTVAQSRVLSSSIKANRSTQKDKNKISNKISDKRSISEDFYGVNDLGVITEEDEEVSQDYNHLKLQYTALRTRLARLITLKQTDAEHILELYKESSERRFSAAEELIATLKKSNSDQSQKISRLEERLEEALAAADEVQRLDLEVEKLSQENKMLKSKFLSTSTTTTTQSSTALDQLKDDMVSDLTGLLIRDIRKEGSNVVFDCLQTGRNGGFHYKLVVPDIEDSRTCRYDEDSEITLIPMLDEKRDELLISLLPDYLTESLTFKRSATAQCFLKVSQALQRNG